MDSVPGLNLIPMSPNCTKIYRVRYNNSVIPFLIKVLITKSRVKGELRTQISPSCTCIRLKGVSGCHLLSSLACRKTKSEIRYGNFRSGQIPASGAYTDWLINTIENISYG